MKGDWSMVKSGILLEFGSPSFPFQSGEGRGKNDEDHIRLRAKGKTLIPSPGTPGEGEGGGRLRLRISLRRFFPLLLAAVLFSSLCMGAVPSVPYAWQNVQIVAGGFVPGIEFQPR